MPTSHADLKTQHERLKSEAEGNPLLFYKCGDFYECLFEDANIMAKAFDIVVTRLRGAQGSNVPLCGIPVHSSEHYFTSLKAEGYTLQICRPKGGENRTRGPKVFLYELDREDRP